jgi:hypothetical protein
MTAPPSSMCAVLGSHEPGPEVVRRRGHDPAGPARGLAAAAAVVDPDQHARRVVCELGHRLRGH